MNTNTLYRTFGWISKDRLDSYQEKPVSHMMMIIQMSKIVLQGEEIKKKLRLGMSNRHDNWDCNWLLRGNFLHLVNFLEYNFF